MATDESIPFETLVHLARHSAAVTCECACASASYAGWERMQLSFPEKQMRVVGTLVKDPYDEPTFAEYHPAGTNYWSTDAPIAVRHFPYNRCAVWQCTECERSYLAYTEGGGYYVECRLRALDPGYLVNQDL